MKPSGIELEKLVQAIYDEILKDDGFDTVNVQHNVNVEGKSGQSHQIDVFWEFKVAGVLHKCAVECKDYKGTVSIGKIRDFSAVLDDIGNVNGIFVTTNGFQAGAVKFAKHKDILLKVVRPPTEEDISMTPGVRTLIVNIHGICLGRCDVKPVFDINWILDNTDLQEGEHISFSGETDKMEILDGCNRFLGTIHDFENKLPRGKVSARGLKYEFSFDQAFLKVPGIKHVLKLKQLKFDYDIYILNNRSRTTYSFTAKAVLHDFISGEMFFHEKEIKMIRTE